MLNIRSILHPTDFSPRSDWAFRLACSIAQGYGARLIALHVAPRPFYGLAAAQHHEYHGLWQALHQLQTPDPGIRLEYRLRHGQPLEEILRAVREVPCDLVVMGTHGRSGVRRLLLGSVAEQVVRQAPCPTVVLRAPLLVPVPRFSRLTHAAVTS
jgi:nucleotide-binding universal stress UspA family protein